MLQIPVSPTQSRDLVPREGTAFLSDLLNAVYKLNAVNRISVAVYPEYRSYPWEPELESTRGAIGQLEFTLEEIKAQNLARARLLTINQPPKLFKPIDRNRLLQTGKHWVELYRARAAIADLQTAAPLTLCFPTGELPMSVDATCAFQSRLPFVNPPSAPMETLGRNPSVLECEKSRMGKCFCSEKTFFPSPATCG